MPFYPGKFDNSGAGQPWAAGSANVYYDWTDVLINIAGGSSTILLASLFSDAATPPNSMPAGGFTKVTLNFGRCADFSRAANFIYATDIRMTYAGLPIGTNKAGGIADPWEKFDSTQPDGVFEHYSWASADLAGIDLSDPTCGIRIQVQHSGTNSNTAYISGMQLTVTP